MKYTKDNPLRVVTLFSGYDSQCMALSNLGVPYDLVGWSEIDPWAIKAHDAVFPEFAGRNLGDVAKIDWGAVNGGVDLLTYSSPCQDFSIAGKQAGGDEGSGTRSSLLWEVKKAVRALRPKMLLMENVKALVSKKFVGTFNKWQAWLSAEGYTNFPQVLNAKDYGVPQNRERVFLVSILGDAWFAFPEPAPLERRLKDLLEPEVDDRFYMNQKRVSGFIEGLSDEQRERMRKEKRNGREMTTTRTVPTNTTADGCARSVLATYGKVKWDIVRKSALGRFMQNGAVETEETDRMDGGLYYKGKFIEEGDGLYADASDAFFRGGLDGVSRTLKAEKHDAGVCVGEADEKQRHNDNDMDYKDRIISKPDSDGWFRVERAFGDGTVRRIRKRYRIRKLTPRECFRLMGVSDEDIDKIKAAGISDSQCYKLAGNSIVAPVLEAIFGKMLGLWS